jgi:hypothetical protein
MSQKKMHPSILKFKEFVRNNPKIIQEVRKGNSTWQELYEDWYLLGEDDTHWDSIGEEKGSVMERESSDNKTDWMSTVTGMLKKMDPNQVQHHINNLSQAIGAIQGLLIQFQGSNPPNQVRELEGPKNPFSFRKD